MKVLMFTVITAFAIVGAGVIGVIVGEYIVTGDVAHYERLQMTIAAVQPVPASPPPPPLLVFDDSKDQISWGFE